MCGIIGYIGKNNAYEKVIFCLKKLEYRGYDSSGITLFYNNTYHTFKEKGKINNLVSSLPKNLISNIGIGHTRWATHGQNNIENAHPHHSLNNKIILVHNGIIDNYLDLKKELINKGYSFYSQTDSEVIANIIEENYQNNPLEALEKSFKQIKGSFALSIIFTQYTNRLYAVKKESSLIIGKSDDGIYISSDINALIDNIDQYYILEDDEIVEIIDNNIYLYDAFLRKKAPIFKSITKEISNKKINNYQTNMEEEINEQNLIYNKLINTYIKNNTINFSTFNINDFLLSQYKEIILIGCGSSYNAGLIGKYLFEHISSLRASCYLASEFEYLPFLDYSKTLFILISQSGETIDTIKVLRTLKSHNETTISIVNVMNSTIARESSYFIDSLAGKEIAVATTKAFFSQVFILYLLAFKIGKINNTKEANKLNNLLSLNDEINHALNDYQKEIDKITHQLVNKKSVFFIGRGLDYILLNEASLKLKEINYIHSEAFPSGELKHGTISLIDKDSLTIALIYQTKHIDKMLSSIEEIKAREGKIIIIGKCEEHDITLTKEIDDLFSPLITLIIFQRIALECAKKKGYDIDMPRNLAKSVTVQ
ncbi:MAG: glutamine--fructose-6-phosphate transaminase (isomerizing) [Bacillales bacterium]|nr:glutamine--fructose-6-phosphate transaminase (isomerizing) [Bacillales bacterium]